MAASPMRARINIRLLYAGSRRSFFSSPRIRADEVRIVEVGPRDGLQNEKNRVELATKLELVRRLSQTGLTDMEAGSFVRPNWVPQMADSDHVLDYILSSPISTHQSVRYNFLVPNLKGFQNFLRLTEDKAVYKHETTQESLNKPDQPDPTTSPQDPNAYPVTPPSSPTNPQSTEEEEEKKKKKKKKKERDDTEPMTSSEDPNEVPTSSRQSLAPGTGSSSSVEISIFAAATETFSKANTNCTIAESLDRFQPIISLAKKRDIRVRGYVSVALGCPYEGPDVSPTKVAEISRALLEMGVDEVSVADTTGMGTAPRTRELLKALSAAGIANADLALHFHDTYGQALVNTMVGLEHGIRTFDSSVAGLGGCPYSKGATGNIASEDLVYCLHSLGVKTGIDEEKLAETGSWISQRLGRQNDSRAGKAILARLSS